MVVCIAHCKCQLSVLQVHDLLYAEERYSTVLCVAPEKGISATWTRHPANHDIQSSNELLAPQARYCYFWESIKMALLAPPYQPEIFRFNIDLQNKTCLLQADANAADNHPCKLHCNTCHLSHPLPPRCQLFCSPLHGDGCDHLACQQPS